MQTSTVFNFLYTTLSDDSTTPSSSFASITSTSDDYTYLSHQPPVPSSSLYNLDKHSIILNTNFTGNNSNNDGINTNDTMFDNGVVHKEFIFDRVDVRIIFITLYSLVFCSCFFGKYNLYVYFMLFFIFHTRHLYFFKDFWPFKPISIFIGKYFLSWRGANWCLKNVQFQSIFPLFKNKTFM